MPKNCSADVEAVIAHVDKVFTSGSHSEINSIKASFGLQNMTHLDDVAGACERDSVDVRLSCGLMQYSTELFQCETTCGIGRVCLPTRARVANSSGSATLSRLRMVSPHPSRAGVLSTHCPLGAITGSLPI